MSFLVDPVPIREKAETLQALCRLFQALAICKLIDQADPSAFAENLVRSGQARRYYLRKSQEEGNVNDRFLGLSRVESVLDTVAAGDFDLARQIADSSVDEWHPGWEYEDDFCYFLFFHRLTLGTPFVDSSEAAALLLRFERALEGASSGRLEICQAVHRQSEVAFWTALERVLADFQAANERRRARITEFSADAAFWPRSFVSVEALAWLRVAETFGWQAADAFAYCPREAMNIRVMPVDDLFESLDRALRGA